MDVQRDLKIGNEQFALLVTTQHGSITARTAVHSQRFRRRIGGARFVRRGDVAEVGHLAAGMTWKCAAAGLPADGQKSVIACPDGIPETDREKADVLGEHVRAVRSVDPGVIFGPDMNNGEPSMNLASEDDELRDHITGLSGTHGGLSIDERGYTAHGLIAGVRAASKLRGSTLRTASIQGFGAVGSHSGRLLAEAGIAVRAVSVYQGALIADGALDVKHLFAEWDVKGDAAFDPFRDSTPDGVRFDPDRDGLLETPADVFVPAARTGVLAMPDELERVRELENPQCRDVTQFYAATGCKLVAQGANHPLTPAAEEYLESKGVIVLPDYIVNCGGLIGCYFEWAYRSELLTSPARREEMHAQAIRVIARIVETNVETLLAGKGAVRARARALAEAQRERLIERCSNFSAESTDHEIADACLDDLVAG